MSDPSKIDRSKNDWRYRWLREQVDRGPDLALCEWFDGGWSPISGYCDEWVDRAMAAAKSAEGANAMEIKPAHDGGENVNGK